VSYQILEESLSITAGSLTGRQVVALSLALSTMTDTLVRASISNLTCSIVLPAESAEIHYKSSHYERE